MQPCFSIILMANAPSAKCAKDNWHKQTSFKHLITSRIFKITNSQKVNLLSPGIFAEIVSTARFSIPHGACSQFQISLAFNPKAL